MTTEPSRHAPRLSRLSPEFRLAIACSVWPPGRLRTRRVSEALQPAIDWELFHRILKRQRVAGLAAHALLTEAIPQPANSAIQATAHRLAQQSLRYAGETLRLSAGLAAAGIPAACLKGSALSALAFGNLGLRHSRDIDLLVAPEQAWNADRILQTLGYRMTMPIGPHSNGQKLRWMRVRKHFEYAHTVTGLQVELHWRLFDNKQLVGKPSSPEPDFSAPLFSGPWTQVCIGGPGASLATLSVRELLLYLCVHGANHMWFRLKWVADIGALLAGGIGDMDLLLRDAQSIGASRAALQALQLSHELFETAPPPAPAANSRAIRSLVGSAFDAMTAGHAATELESVPFGTSRIALARYRLRMDGRFWLRELRSGLHDERDRETFGLPASLTFLLPFLRIPFWLARRVAGLGRSNRQPRAVAPPR